MAEREPESLESTLEGESPEETYSPDYLRECADGEARQERLAELRRRIELGAYRIDADRVAFEMLSRGDLDAD
ncbi:MAG: flagellar biosynthesis anti-sigma factor FlgM [Myxococcota bacterium]